MRKIISAAIFIYQLLALLAVILVDDFKIDMIIITTQWLVLGFQLIVLPALTFKDDK